MPVRKPDALQKNHETKAIKQARQQAEAAMSPSTILKIDPPAELKGHPKAQIVWKYTLKIYNELSAKIVTSLDRGILTDYCLLMEQLVELEKLRVQNVQALSLVQENLKKLTGKKKDPAQVIAEQLAIVDKMATLTEAFYKLDQRADRKRTLIHTLRQSLYLTPRARAGVAPSSKEVEPEKDDMEKLLEEIS